MERVKVYKDAKIFWNEVSPHLKIEEAKNGLCLGLSYGFRANPAPCIYQAALFHKNEFMGAVVCSQYVTNCNLVLTPVRDLNTAERLFAAVEASRIPINGVLGEALTADIYRRLLQDSGRKAKTIMNQGVYRCARVHMPEIPKGIKFRAAEMRDTNKIGEWIEKFHREAVPHDPPIVGREAAAAKIKNRMIYVIEKNGHLLAMAGWGRDIETSCSINLVFTPKSLRGKGYGSFITALLTRHFLKKGKRETNLFTDMNNPTSNKIYQRIGYELVCNAVYYRVK